MVYEGPIIRKIKCNVLQYTNDYSSELATGCANIFTTVSFNIDTYCLPVSRKSKTKTCLLPSAWHLNDLLTTGPHAKNTR